MNLPLIIDAVRTPRAKRKGKFAGVHPVDLLTYPLIELVKRTGIAPEMVEDVVVGCVTQAGEQAWCVGRKSVLATGWPFAVPATTVNRLRGSGQQAVNFVASSIAAGTYDLAIGGGLEHTTRAPMFSDTGGEESPMLLKHYPDLVNQGLSAEMICEEHSISREQCDEFSFHSQQRAKKASDEGRFKASLVPVPYKLDGGVEGVLSVDDNIRGETTVEGLSQLKPAFKEGGSITAGNASAIVDGAAAVLLASEKKAKELKLKPRGRIVASYVTGSPPKIMLTGPVAASQEVLKRAGLKTQDIDVWEINEAFAPVPILVMRELQLDPAKVNINGGGISLGHPLGATGAMLIGSAIDELHRTKGRYAVVTMCIGLGMGIATVIEAV